MSRRATARRGEEPTWRRAIALKIFRVLRRVEPFAVTKFWVVISKTVGRVGKALFSGRPLFEKRALGGGRKPTWRRAIALKIFRVLRRVEPFAVTKFWVIISKTLGEVRKTVIIPIAIMTC